MNRFMLYIKAIVSAYEEYGTPLFDSSVMNFLIVLMENDKDITVEEMQTICGIVNRLLGE